MGYAESLRSGRRSMAAGRWAEAREELTRARDEQETAEVLDDLAGTLWWAGDARESIGLRERAHELHRTAGDVRGATMSALDLSVCYLTNLDNEPAARGWLARARSLATGATGATDPRLEGWVALVGGYMAADRAVGRELLGMALRIARESTDVDLELVALADLGLVLVSGGDVVDGLELLDEAMAGTLGGGFDRLETVVWTSCSMLAACSLVGDLQRAARWCSAADRFTLRFGCPFLQARCRAHYGRVLVGTGRWEEAESELDAALAMAGEVGAGPRAEAMAGLADLRLRQGKVEEAAALVSEVEDDALAAVVRAQVEIAGGAPERAVAILRSRAAVLEPAEPEYPVVLTHLVDALLAAGDAEAAEVQVELLRSRCAGHQLPQLEPLSLLASGRVAAARSRPEEAVRCLRAAAAGLTSLDLGHDAARARLDLARAAAVEDPALAVVEAGRALRSFEGLGARRDAAAAAAVLRSLGVAGAPGPRGRTPLSEREREVLELVEQGLSNPQIGQRLFISRKTVGHHVSSILSKLGLSSRAEAAAYAARSHRSDQR